MTTNLIDACPLCSRLCPIEMDEATATFTCSSCYTFRMFHPAVERLAELSFAHRNVLILDPWQAHLIGRVLLITLAQETGYKVFDRRRISI